MVLFVIMLSPCAALGGESTDAQFLEGLRQRRLYELAAEFCQERLTDPQLSDADRATLTIELARSRAGQALNAPASERQPHWQAAIGALTDFAARYPAHPRLFLIRVQEALTLLARGELARQEAEIGADSPEARADARGQLREAARRLETLERELQREIPLRLNARPVEGGLSSEELTSLLDDVRYQLARVLRNQALSYPPASADRVNALAQAIDRLDEVRRRVGEGDPLYWSCRLDLVLCHRLLEKPEEAARRLAEMESQNPPPAVVLQTRAERARLALAAARPQDALAAIASGRALHGQTSAELDLAHLETYIALWKAAEAKNERNDADAWRGKALAMTRLIEQSHGPYWRRRAETLLTNSASEGAAPGDLDILTRTARDHYLRGRHDEAITTYDAAAGQAQAASDAKQAFDLFYKAAAIEHQRANHRQAAERFRELAVSLPTHPLAAGAHLLGCFNLAQAARKDESLLDAYAAALEEHLQYWPDEADQARLWLGRLRESQQRWSDAVKAYRGMAPTFAEYEAAVAGAGRAWLRWLAELREANQDPTAEANEAARWFESVAGSDSANGSSTALQAAIHAARVRLRFLSSSAADAERVLRLALEGVPEAEGNPARAEAAMLLVVALADQPQKADQAAALLREAADASPQQLWEVIQSLTALVEEEKEATDGASARRGRLANLTLEAIELLGDGASQLSEPSQVEVRRARAAALTAAGRVDEARQSYAALAKSHPQDGRIQEEYGDLLLLDDDETTRAAALRQWRAIAARSRPRGDRWWRAKHHVALLHYRNGDREQAAQLIRYLKEIPPGLDGSPVRDELLELLKRCVSQ